MVNWKMMNYFLINVHSVHRNGCTNVRKQCEINWSWLRTHHTDCICLSNVVHNLILQAERSQRKILYLNFYLSSHIQINVQIEPEIWIEWFLVKCKRWANPSYWWRSINRNSLTCYFWSAFSWFHQQHRINWHQGDRFMHRQYAWNPSLANIK